MGIFIIFGIMSIIGFRMEDRIDNVVIGKRMNNHKYIIYDVVGVVFILLDILIFLFMKFYPNS